MLHLQENVRNYKYKSVEIKRRKREEKEGNQKRYTTVYTVRERASKRMIKYESKSGHGNGKWETVERQQANLLKYPSE